MPPRSFQLAAAAAGFALAVSGCAAAAGADQTPEQPTAPAVAWSVNDIEPMSGVTMVDGVAVILAKQADTLQLVGLDPETGSVLWRKSDVTPSAVPPGIRVGFTDLDGKVVYLRRDPAVPGGLDARIAFLDAKSGIDLAVSERRRFTSQPGSCTGNDAALCVSASNPSTGAAVSYQLRADAQLQPRTEPEGSRDLSGDGLLDLGTRTPEQLAYAPDGSVKWAVDLSSAFGPGASTDGGWFITREPSSAGDVYVGSVGKTVPSAAPRPGTRITVNLADNSTAGISANDGRALWREPGTDRFCLTSLGAIAGATTLPAIRCRVSGTISYTAPASGGEPADITTSGIRVALEGYDPATGATRWSADLGSAPDLYQTSLSQQTASLNGGHIRISDQEAAFRTGTATIAVNLTDGTRRQLDPAATGWCAHDPYMTFRDGWTAGGDTTYQRHGGGLVILCDQNGSPAPTNAQPAAVPSSMSADAGSGRRIVATPSSVIAYNTAAGTQ